MTATAPARHNEARQPPQNQATDSNGARPLPPQNVDAETAVLGLCLTNPTAADAAAAVIGGKDFYQPRHETLWYAVQTLAAAGQPTDPIAVHHELQRRGDTTRAGGAPYLHTLVEQAPIAGDVTYYARLIATAAERRRLAELGTKLVQQAHVIDDLNPTEIRAAAHTWLDERPLRAAAAPQPPPDLDEFLHTDDTDDYDWVIPGLLERHDRLMLTGPEGGGKSTFCRQVAVMAASGIHPFTGELTDPITVLYVDLENSARQTRRKLRPLRIAAADLYQPGRLRIEVRPSGIDLLDTDDQRWLEQLATAVRPDLVITGPIYRMASGDPTEEKTAKPVSAALDRIRELGCAVILETHTPHATGGQKKRPLRPYGASLWMRWPEFGVHLDSNGDLDHWRGARDEREWPAMLRRGGKWPWTPISDEATLRWATIRGVREEHGAFMTERDVVTATGMAKTTVHRILERFKYDWIIVNGRAEDGPDDRGDDE